MCQLDALHFWAVAFLARPLEISSEGALVPKSSEAPRFGAILRVRIQWVNKSKQNNCQSLMAAALLFEAATRFATHC